MKFTIAAATAAFSLLVAGSASQVQSNNFTLRLTSKDAAYDKKYLGACHAGAAIESLCIGDKGTPFKFNTTKGTSAPVKGYSAPGVITYDLHVTGSDGKPFVESEPMSLPVEVTNNIAAAIFSPTPYYDAQPVTFSKDGKLGIISYVAAGKVTPTDGSAHVLDNWYVCQTGYGGYQYKALAWLVGAGAGKADNPTCVKVSVQRHFI